jgi:nucleotide-binding universal stress UspA family protein
MSQLIDCVLLAFGPDDREHVQKIVDAALQLVEPTGAKLHLLHVFPQEEYNELIQQMDVSPSTESFGPDKLAARNDLIRTQTKKLDERDIKHEICGAVGTPDTEIVRMAENLSADRLFIGGRSRSPAGKAMFGDYAQQVLLHSPCPVTYVQRE